MADVRLYHTVDDGEIDVVNGQFAMSDGIETAVYLSLFGGNEEDSGGDEGESKQWWGNLGEPVASRRYRSETQHLLRALPATPANLRRIEDAANRDLAWLLEEIATSISVSVTMPGLNRISITVKVLVNGESEFVVVSFNQSWGAA